MKIENEELKYKLKFDDDKEMEEFMIWCFDNKIFDVVRMHYHPKNIDYSSVDITFNDDESVMGFKLRWL